MNDHDTLWHQKANSRHNIFVHFGYFLYEFIGARFTIIAFIGLFNFAAIGLEVFNQILIAGVSIFLYLLIADAFKVFWTGINLEYAITKKGIMYSWGVFRIHELFIPFENISKIRAIRDIKGKRQALIFENDEKLKNGDFGFSKEIHFKVLSFENVDGIEDALELLKDLSQAEIEIVSNSVVKSWTENLPNFNLYYKFLQLLAFIFIYISTSILITLIDVNVLKNHYIKDLVIHQEKVIKGENHRFNLLETQSGYKIKLSKHYEYLDEEVGFYVSPIFGLVTKFDSYKMEGYEDLKSGYKGFNIFFKVFALIIMLFSASYIFYRRNNIPFRDLAVFLLFPIFILFVAFYLFH